MAQNRVNGAALRTIRERTPLTVAELADQITAAGVRVSRDHLYNIELGHKDGSMSLAVAASRVLMVPVTALLREPQGIAAGEAP
jgi:transcriptional regulator with XRE-family HTH domain